MCPVKEGKSQQLIVVVSKFYLNCWRALLSVEMLDLAVDTLQHGLYLLSANFTKTTQPSGKLASNVKIDNMRFRAPLLMEESSAFSKNILLLSVC